MNEDEDVTVGSMASPPEQVRAQFESGYNAYVSAVRAADADAWKRAYELYCDYQRNMWEAARDQSQERATEAVDAYQKGLVEAWRARARGFDQAYAGYGESLKGAFGSIEFDAVDSFSLSAIGYSMMLVAQGAALASAHSPPPAA